MPFADIAGWVNLELMENACQGHAGLCAWAAGLMQALLGPPENAPEWTEC